MKLKDRTSPWRNTQWTRQVLASPAAPPPGTGGPVAIATRAAEQHDRLDDVLAVCLAEICALGSWTCATVRPLKWNAALLGEAPGAARYPASPPDTGALTHAISLSVPVEADSELLVELSGVSADIDDRHMNTIEVAVAAVLLCAIERWRALRDRASAEAERARQWTLIKQSEEALRDQYARLHTAVNNMRQGLAMYDGNGDIVICNNLYATMYGLSLTAVRRGTSNRAIARARMSRGVDIGDETKAIAYGSHGTLSIRSEADAYQLPDGRTIEVTVQPLWDGGWVTTHEDVTERKRFEERISQLAHCDHLTGLSNRLAFRQRLDAALAEARANGGLLAVLCLDLDRFKSINDTLGHPIGDRVLNTIGRRLRECVRRTDVVARLGGDEFAVLQTTIGRRADVTALARRIQKAVAEPVRVDDYELSVDTSIGICMAPGEIESADELLRNADIALYRAKSDGRRTYRYFDFKMDAAEQARRLLEADLKRALKDEEFVLHYQPIVDLATGAIAGCEALLRWNHPTRGIVMPGHFIPAAEETGLMIELGRWTLERACSEAASWPAATRVAVNISPSHVMSQRLQADVVAALDRSRLDPRRLEIEITEAVVMGHTDLALRVLDDLRAIGVQFAMDDFGTGFSSLSYLHRFPFSKIKIDRSFVSGLPSDRSSYEIVKAIVSLAQSLGIVTTVEGVETPAQSEIVKALGCTQMQGYLISKPVSAEQMGSLFGMGRTAGDTSRLVAA